MNQLTMRIEGKPHIFYQAEIAYSIEQLAHTFRCTIAPLVVEKPLSVEFYISDKRIFLGQIDQVDTDTDSSQHRISIVGRSISANMIDSRITMDALYGMTIEQILRKLAEPYGLGVKSSVANMPSIFEFQVNAESPIENVAQIAREQGLMLLEHEGELVIEDTAPYTIENVGLEVGKNIENLTIKRTFNGQFHTIEVQGMWDDSQSVTTNTAIHQSRTLVITCDQLQTIEACQSRANYEHNLALAKSLTATASIPGIFPELTGKGLNRMIRVIDDRQSFREMLVIKAIGLSVSENSVSTNIELMRPFRE